MLGRVGKLSRLQEELQILDLLDRLHDYSAGDPNRRDHHAYAFRQRRRSEIVAEIETRSARRPWFQGLRLGSVALLVCATLYATFHYLLK